MDVVQTAVFIQTMSYEAGLLEYEEFPVTTEPVYILGKKYDVTNELDELKHDFCSRLWFTYRKCFQPIGGCDGPTSDAGWGCMLRCGQMMLAQALVLRHLGRDWRWHPGKYDPKYFEILRLFLDKKGSPYSIHQIANMGASEGKRIGEWFGPNTIAQVLKKLAVYDDWSNIVVHIALDNTIITDDIKALCFLKPNKVGKNSPEDSMCQHCKISAVKSTKHRKTNEMHKDCDSLNGVPDGDQSSVKCDIKLGKTCCCNCHCDKWRPLLLVIPLRLGLSEINPVYANALRTCLSFPQSVGIIGGRPNHAHWFVGYVENELVYLDPHTTHNFTDITSPDQTDDTFHCDYVSRMKIIDLDPSIALGFYCGSESSFMDLCQRIKVGIIQKENTPMFELHEHRPPHWPSFQPYTPEGATGTDFTLLDDADRQFDTDEEFELL
ncbi:hypothetical protein LSH36_256g02042 [Paralvinella palmiformis]|uniref:Cysteine protease n=1 Tax=Paralvinella palmiformis TaxID=53620 RepID=A0AAD9JKD2_9ANNE|nr:hypothetical protein LSH36_256g02042 [Paralvinella palmiformis]